MLYLFIGLLVGWLASAELWLDPRCPTSALGGAMLAYALLWPITLIVVIVEVLELEEIDR